MSLYCNKNLHCNKNYEFQLGVIVWYIQINNYLGLYGLRVFLLT